MAELSGVLSSVDWNANVIAFCKAPSRVDRLAGCCEKISYFTHALSFYDFDNPALPFLQEMKASAFQVPACLALGMAKPAAGLMRAAVENALYFSYFRSHPAELRTLVTDEKYYLSKRLIMEFHKVHTPNFAKAAGKLGLFDKIDGWYSKISAIVHGQIPGVWTSKSLAQTAALGKLADEPVKLFERAAEIIQLTLLATIPGEEWEAINPISRRKLLSGLTQANRAILGLPRV